MSNTIKVTKHVYISKYGVEDFYNPNEEFRSNDLHVFNTEQEGTDYFLYVCPIDVEVEIPSQDEARLKQLAGMEAEYKKYKEKSLEQLAHMENQMAELRALTYQEEVA